MPRSVQQIDSLIQTEFEVFDSSNNPVLGLVTADFIIFLSYNLANIVLPVVINEIGNGRYGATFTPNADGFWELTIRNATYNQRGWTEGFDVDEAGYDIYSYVIDGYTLAQILELVGAALAGNVYGAPLNPVFLSMDGLKTRIAAICDASGDRTVTLTP